MISSASTISPKPKASESTSAKEANTKTKNDESGILDFLDLLQINSEVAPGAKHNLLSELSGNTKDLLSKMDMKQLQELMANTKNAGKGEKLNAKENLNLLELLAKNNNLKVKDDQVLKVNTKNSFKNQESLSALDFQMNKPSVQTKEGLKGYLKSQDTKVIKSDSLNILDKNDQSDISPKLLNEFNFGNSKPGTVIDGSQSGQKNVIESLATQITQRINDMNSVRPMQFNTETSININHSELGQMTLSIKKIQNELSIQITTGEKDAKNILFENRDALLSQLNSKGISVSNLSIDTVFSASASDDAKGFQSQKFDSSSQHQGSAEQQQHAKNSNQQHTDREKRNELWDILKDQREVMYA